MRGTALTLGSVAALALGAVVRSRALSTGSPNHALSSARRDAFSTLARDFVAQMPLLTRPPDGSWYEETASPMSRLRPTAARAWGESRGFRYLGHGSHRVVFAVPGGVLKIEDPAWMPAQDAVPSNTVEARVWRDAPPTIRPHLVPVLASSPDGNWILMEYAVPRTDPSQRDLGYDAAPDVDQALSNCGLADLHNHNLSLDGRILDYGTIVDPTLWDACVRGKTVVKGQARRLGSSARHDLPDHRGILLNPRDPDSRGRVRRKTRDVGGGRAKIDLVAEVIPAGERLSSGEIRATRVDDLSLLFPGVRAAIQRLDDRRGVPIPRAYVVHTANIEPHGRGWGQILYRAMAMRAAEEDAVLVSHACTPSGLTSNAAENMWEKLGRSILVEHVETYVESGEDEDDTYDGPCFVAWGAPAGSFVRTGGSRSLAAPVSPYFRQSAQKIRVYRGTRGNCDLCPDSRGVTYWTDDPAVADRYAGGKPGRAVHAGRLYLHNPYVLETDAAARQLASWLDAARGITRDLDDDPWWHDYFRVVDQAGVPRVLAARGYDGIRFMDVIDQSNHVAWAIWDSRKFTPG